MRSERERLGLTTHVTRDNTAHTCVPVDTRRVIRLRVVLNTLRLIGSCVQDYNAYGLEHITHDKATHSGCLDVISSQSAVSQTPYFGAFPRIITTRGT